MKLQPLTIDFAPGPGAPRSGLEPYVRPAAALLAVAALALVTWMLRE